MTCCIFATPVHAPCLFRLTACILTTANPGCALFDGGSVLSYLKLVKTFLDNNPNEVLTLLFTNPEGLSPATVWKPIFDAAGMYHLLSLSKALAHELVLTGISNLTYIPSSLPVKQSDWPTLGSMIDAGTRVVVFLDSQADGPAPVNFILPEFSMVFLQFSLLYTDRVKFNQF